jgi:aconitate hydratase
MSKNTFKTLATLSVGSKQEYSIYRLDRLAPKYTLEKLPFCYKILLENLLRNEDGINVSAADIDNLCQWSDDQDDSSKNSSTQSIAFTPARVVLQDFTGVPAVVDLAAMRDALIQLGGDPQNINPKVAVDLVIDHSVMVDYFGSSDALSKNIEHEFTRNKERYNFLRWGQAAFDNFRVVPPGTGIVHQVNLEYLAKVVSTSVVDNKCLAYPDTLVGTDSHTTMINGLGILAWGVGGIEAEAAMLGQPISLQLPQVVGVELTGALPEGTTATDAVLTITELLRNHGVVGKFVEFYGEGLDHLRLADRATIANMAPEYGATMGIFPIDDETLNYLRLTGREEQHINLVEAYAKAQGIWRATKNVAAYNERLQLNLNTIEPCMAGPKRPQDRVPLPDIKQGFQQLLEQEKNSQALRLVDTLADSNSVSERDQTAQKVSISNANDHSEKLDVKTLTDGDIVIAAITSCTNTSNPAVMLAAGLLAKKACDKGLKVKPWVKTSLAPGSQVVPAYLASAGLTDSLNSLGFQVVGFGCTTCIGNSGPLPEKVSQQIEKRQLIVASVLSGNRNFEGRIHPEVKANYLASPPLVVAYALAGTVNIDLTKDPIGQDQKGQPVYLRDIWPTLEEVNDLINANMKPELFRKYYADVFKGSEQWQAMPVSDTGAYTWPDSTYIKQPPFFEGMTPELPETKNIINARCLVSLGDSITTDHISPAGAISADSPAGMYLQQQGVAVNDFNSLGSRRGNHEVMLRGTFSNPRIENKLTPKKRGGYTRYLPSNETMSIYDAAIKYQQDQIPLIIVAGKDYGMGSSRDWAAKGTQLLGVRAVIVESFERIHRSNLVGFGILPLEFLSGQNLETLGLNGEELFTFTEIPSRDSKQITIDVENQDGINIQQFKVNIRIDTVTEWDYYFNGGILHTVLRNLL